MRWAPIAEQDRTLSGTINGQFGIFTEATFNPRWGLGLQYMYAMNNQETYDAVNHDIILHSSFNLSNIVAPYRSMGLQKLNVYFNPGVVGTIGVWENSSKVADDNKFVDCAICGNAELLVTNDAHFDILKTIGFPKVEIIKLQEFVNII